MVRAGRRGAPHRDGPLNAARHYSTVDELKLDQVPPRNLYRISRTQLLARYVAHSIAAEENGREMLQEIHADDPSRDEEYPRRYR